MKSSVALACLALAAALPARADIIGVYAGGGYWHNHLSGDLLATDTSANNELGLDNANLGQWYINIEHPLPLLPNLRVAYSDISAQGQGNLDSGIVFDDKTFSGQVSSNFAVKMTDATFYYQLWDTGGDLDLGITARKLDGEVRLQSTGQQGSARLNDWLPMLYGKARVDLPLTGLYAGVQGNGLAYSGNRLLDYSAFVGYDFDIPGPVDVGVELGYRRLELKLADIGDFESDLRLSGPFANLTVHF